MIVTFTLWLQEGEEYVKKIGGIFVFKVKDGPEGKEATWVVDVKNGKGCVDNNTSECRFFKEKILRLLD